MSAFEEARKAAPTVSQFAYAQDCIAAREKYFWSSALAHAAMVARKKPAFGIGEEIAAAIEKEKV